jgi:hypothetical protein
MRLSAKWIPLSNSTLPARLSALRIPIALRVHILADGVARRQHLRHNPGEAIKANEER